MQQPIKMAANDVQIKRTSCDVYTIFCSVNTENAIKNFDAAGVEGDVDGA